MPRSRAGSTFPHELFCLSSMNERSKLIGYLGSRPFSGTTSYGTCTTGLLRSSIQQASACARYPGPIRHFPLLHRITNFFYANLDLHPSLSLLILQIKVQLKEITAHTSKRQHQDEDNYFRPCNYRLFRRFLRYSTIWEEASCKNKGPN